MDTKNYQEDLLHIRKMMEQSSRFISLSGLSGVFAGLTALIGVGLVYYIFRQEGISYLDLEHPEHHSALIEKLAILGLAILVVAILCGYAFTARKTKNKKQKMWDTVSKKLLINFSIPLITGGVFCIALINQQLYLLIAPVTLLFYGLALVSAERYTLTDVKYLGFLEIVLGLISLFMLKWGLLFWALGFGVLHIVYGLIMYKKYK